jgi:gluconate kinase
MLLILFGLSASGKNFVGEILAEQFNYHFWDADTILPPVMLDAIKQKATFTQQMRDDFTTNIIQHVTQIQKQHNNLVVTQAFYKESNRLQLLHAFPTAKLVQIKAEPSIIAARLEKNNKSIDIDYAEKIKVNFEDTKLPHTAIVNNTDKTAVISQIKTILNQ